MLSFNTCNLTINAIKSVYESIIDKTIVFEIIVVDNFSNDNSANLVESEFPQVNVIRSNVNLGFGKGNNYGSKFAQGDYILFLNTDTIVQKGAIEKLLNGFKQSNKIGIVGPYLLNPDGSYQISIMSFPNAWRIFCLFFWLDKLFPSYKLFSDSFMLHADINKKQFVEVISGASLMIKRNLFYELKGFDEEFFMYFEENDLCKRCFDKGYLTLFVPESKVIHFGNQSSSSKPVSYTHLRAHETVLDLVCRLLLEKKHIKCISHKIV